MMKIAGHIIIGVLSACLVCCTKTVSVEQEDSRIMFYGRSVFLQTGTKGIVPDENMTLPIYVTDDSETNPAFEATKIEYHLDNGLWYTDNPGWVSGKQYRLYAYILSQGNGQSVSVDIKDDLTKPGRKSGTHFTVSQPASYSADENAYADFLLSYPKNADGTDNRQVTRSSWHENQPTWIKGGEKLAFLCNESGSNQVWEMNPDGTGRKRLTQYDGNIEGFAFSPDEKQLLFIAQVKTVKSTKDKYPDVQALGRMDYHRSPPLRGRL